MYPPRPDGGGSTLIYWPPVKKLKKKAAIFGVQKSSKMQFYEQVRPFSCDDCDTPELWFTIGLRFLIYGILQKSWKFAEKRQNESFLLIFVLIKAFI